MTVIRVEQLSVQSAVALCQRSSQLELVATLPLHNDLEGELEYTQAGEDWNGLGVGVSEWGGISSYVTAREAHNPA